MTTLTIPETHADTVARMRDIETELERLSRHDQLTRAQEQRLGSLSTEFDALDSHRLRLERAEQLDRIRTGAGGIHLEPGSQQDRDDSAARRTSERDRAHRVLERAHAAGHLPDYAAERAAALVDNPRDVRGVTAEWVEATGDDAYMRAFMHLAADPERGHLMWSEQERAAFQRVQEFRAMSLTDANGGYMVPLTLDPALILTSAGSVNPMRRLSRVVTTHTDSWTGLTSAGVTAEWKAEAAEAADASPTVDDQPIPVHFGDAFVPYSYEVGMDAVNFLPELQKLLVDGADQLQATAYTLGTGTGQPKGLITALAGTASELNAAADDTFAVTDVYRLIEALPPRFRDRAQWMGNLSILNLIKQFQSSGNPVFPEIDSDRLLRRAVNENSFMDATVTTTGAVSNFILAVGDFQNFVIVDRIGTTLEFIPNLVGANRRPTGQRGAFLWFRTGSDCVNINAFRLLDVASAI